MKNSYVLSGVIPVLITPLTEDYQIDERGLLRLLEFLYSKPIGGLWVLGTGGEDMSLTYAQRLKVAEIVSDFNEQKLPIMLGTSFFSVEETFAFIKDTRHLKITAYHYMPYHTLIGLDNIETSYRLIAEQCSSPLWMYTSANWSKNIPAEFIGRLSDHSNIGGIKFSTSNAVDIEKAISFQSDQFQVITAVVKQFFSSLALGAKAGTTVEACLFPDGISSIYAHYTRGDYDASLHQQRKLNRQIEKTITSASHDNFLRVAEIKYALSLRGICTPTVSRPYRSLNSKEQSIIRTALALGDKT
jgi:dihydrodipicolinate synthase/N-acetylneuraminate lyase